MGKAIVSGMVLIILVSIVAFVVRRSLREAAQVGDLNLKQERALRNLVADACKVMAGLGVAASIEDSDVISERSRTAINDWVRRYNRYQNEEINA